MNLKKIILSCGIIAGLSLFNVPQAKANDWQSLAGLASGFRAGVLLPTIAISPIGYALDTLCMSIGSSLAAGILSIASGSSFEQYTNNGKGNDFHAGFFGAFPVGFMAIVVIGALAIGSNHTSFDFTANNF